MLANMKFYKVKMRDKKEFEVNETEYIRIKNNVGRGSFIELKNGSVLNPSDITYIDFLRKESDLLRISDRDYEKTPLTTEEKANIREMVRTYRPAFLRDGLEKRDKGMRHIGTIYATNSTKT